MKIKFLKKVLFVSMLSTALFSCKNHDDNPPVVELEEELITTVKVTFTESGNVENPHSAEFLFTDLDGDGGNSPVFSAEDVFKDVAYDVSVEFLNQSVNPAEDITEEISELSIEHQVFIELIDVAGATLSYDDIDGNGKPLGLNSTWEFSSTVADGEFKLSLIHEPTKPANYILGNPIPNTVGGSTDIEVTFPLKVVNRIE